MRWLTIEQGCRNIVNEDNIQAKSTYSLDELVTAAATLGLLAAATGLLKGVSITAAFLTGVLTSVALDVFTRPWAFEAAGVLAGVLTLVAVFVGMTFVTLAPLTGFVVPVEFEPSLDSGAADGLSDFFTSVIVVLGTCFCTTVRLPSDIVNGEGSKGSCRAQTHLRIASSFELNIIAYDLDRCCPMLDS